MAAWLLPALCLLTAIARAGDPPQAIGSKEDRVLWIFPNYRTVPQANALPRIRAKEKWTIAARDSFDPYAFPVAGLYAGVAQWEDEYPSLGRGVDGYKNRYLGALADQTVSNFMAEGAFPCMLHQDPRYFRLGRGSFWHRAAYALTRTFVTRGDDGRPEFNWSEFGGNAAMAGISSLYYPARYRTAGETAQKWGTQIAIDTVANLGKEFWPDVKRRLLGKGRD